MSVLTMCRRAAVVGIAAGLAVGPVGAEVAAPRVSPVAIAQARSNIVKARVRVPRGILAGVPTGGDPYWASRPQPYPVLSPLAAWVLVPPVVFVPPIADFWPPDFGPFGFGPADVGPIGFEPFGFGPFDFGPCFVPTEHTGQHGYYGSCADSFYQQYTNRPD